jgi:hypothetical protein
METNSNIYKYLVSISPYDYVLYFFVGTIIVLFFNRVQLSPHTFVAIVVAVLVALYFHERKRSEGGDFIYSVTNKLSSKGLRETQNFHLDYKLIDFMTEIKKYRFYNPAVYKKLVKQIDAFLQIVSDMEQNLENIGEMYQLLDDQKIKILNTYHSMIHSLPYSEAQNRQYQEGMTLLNKLLNYHLDKCYKYMQYNYGKTDVTNRLKILYKNHPRAWDTQVDYF